MSDRGYTDKREVWTTVSFLSKSAWFTRVWCVQEAILACNMTMLFEFGEFRPMAIQAFAAWFLPRCFQQPVVTPAAEVHSSEHHRSSQQIGTRLQG